MALNDDIRLLSQLPLFHGMGDEPLRLIAFGADRRRVSEGQTLFREKRSLMILNTVLNPGRVNTLMTIPRTPGA